MGKRYKGAGYLGFCSPDPLGSLGTMLQMCAVAPTTVSDREVTYSWAAVELVQPRVSWTRRQAGGEDAPPSWEGKDYWARSSLCTSLSCMKRLSYVVCIDWWHGEDSPCLLLVNHPLRPAGGDACISPTPPTQGVGCEFRGWLHCELRWSPSCRCVLGNTDLNPQNVCSEEICWLKDYILNREDGIIWNWLFGQIWWHWEQFTNQEAELFWNKVVHVY